MISRGPFQHHVLCESMVPWDKCDHTLLQIKKKKSNKYQALSVLHLGEYKE